MVDTIRTVIVWIVALAVGWERFQYLQPVAFALLVLGFLVYYGTIPLPCCKQAPHAPSAAATLADSEDERRRLKDEGGDDDEAQGLHPSRRD
jgi:hypothetical protein